jgi:hypothetical protein
LLSYDKKIYKKQFKRACFEITLFLSPEIHSNIEFFLLKGYILECFETKEWRTGRPIIEKLIKAEVKCKLKEIDLN